ncbi:MAG TPA: GNAT family N-acetyltransferase [Candidatus Limnocylindrales bacterium]
MNEANVTVRPATPDDAERLASLLTDEGYPAGSSDLAARIERYASLGSQVLVAEAAGDVVGFVTVLVLPRFEVDDLFARVTSLVVDAGVRERGIGRLLMQAAEDQAKAAGAAWLEVTAGHHRPDARRLFESLGFDPGVAAYLRKRV